MEQPYRKLRAVIGSIAVICVLGVWVHAQFTSAEIGTLWEVVALAIVIAGGYAVYGEATMSAAMDDAQDIKGGDEDDSERSE